MEYIRGVVENRSSDRASWATQEERARFLIPRSELSAENVNGLNKKLRHEVGKPTMANLIPNLSDFAAMSSIGDRVRGFPPLKVPSRRHHLKKWCPFLLRICGLRTRGTKFTA